jgi:hypothetical protein
VASWRVLTGANASRLTAAATAPRHGFETAITASQLGAVLQVQALDQAGHVLGTSALVRTG